MKAWRDYIQSRVLKSAIKQGRKEPKPKKNLEKGGFVFVFPSDPQAARMVLQPVREWLADHPEGPVRIIVPKEAQEVARKLKAGVRTITFELENDRTKSGVPTRELRRHVSHLQANVAVLLADEPDSFEEILFALINANLKAALFTESRTDHVQLLVQARGEHSRTKKIQLLLDAISTFGQEQVPTKSNSDSARRARRTFSTENASDKS
ncbi:MAG: hypothetical protein V2A56_12590 [bacterium]